VGGENVVDRQGIDRSSFARIQDLEVAGTAVADLYAVGILFLAVKVAKVFRTSPAQKGTPQPANRCDDRRMSRAVATASSPRGRPWPASLRRPGSRDASILPQRYLSSPLQPTPSAMLDAQLGESLQHRSPHPQLRARESSFSSSSRTTAAKRMPKFNLEDPSPPSGLWPPPPRPGFHQARSRRVLQRVGAALRVHWKILSLKKGKPLPDLDRHALPIQFDRREGNSRLDLLLDVKYLSQNVMISRALDSSF